MDYSKYAKKEREFLSELFSNDLDKLEFTDIHGNACYDGMYNDTIVLEAKLLTDTLHTAIYWEGIILEEKKFNAIKALFPTKNILYCIKFKCGTAVTWVLEDTYIWKIAMLTKKTHEPWLGKEAKSVTYLQLKDKYRQFNKGKDNKLTINN